MSDDKLRTFHMNFCVSDEEAGYAIRNTDWKEQIVRLIKHDLLHKLAEVVKPTFYHYHDDDRQVHNVIAEIEIPEKYLVDNGRENVYTDKNIALAIQPGWMVGVKMFGRCGTRLHLADVFIDESDDEPRPLCFVNDDGWAEPLFIHDDDGHVTTHLNPIIYYVYKPNQQGDYIKVWEKCK